MQKLGPGDAHRRVLAVRRRNDRIVGAVNNQRRNFQRLQPIVARRRGDDGRHLARRSRRIVGGVVDAAPR